MNCARCEKCGEVEPYDWDYQRAGLWVCDCSGRLPTREEFIDCMMKAEKYLKDLENGNSNNKNRISRDN